MRSNLLRCPNCEANHFNQTLGECLPDGRVRIQLRRHKERVNYDYVIISGEDFEVSCGHCSEVVYFRRERRASEGEVLGYRRIRLYREIPE